MKFLLCLLMCFGLTTTIHAENLTTEPETITDPEFKGLTWHRWVNGKFTILALNDAKAEWVSKNVISLEKEIQAKWQYKKYSVNNIEIKIIAVNDKNQLLKMFGLNEPRVEYLQDKQTIVIWTVFDSSPQQCFVPYLTQSLLLYPKSSDLKSVQSNFWYIRGAGFLSGDPALARAKLKILQDLKKDGIFTSAYMLNLTQEEYLKLSNERKQLFDSEATAFCLLLRQEFGLVKLNSFVDSNDVTLVYGFKDIATFDETFKRYLSDVGLGLSQNKMPDSYLTIATLTK